MFRFTSRVEKRRRKKKKRLSLQETRPVSGAKPASNEPASHALISRIFFFTFSTGHDFYSRNAISTTRCTICKRKATVNYSFLNIDNQQRRPRRTLLGQGRHHINITSNCFDNETNNEQKNPYIRSPPISMFG